MSDTNHERSDIPYDVRASLWELIDAHFDGDADKGREFLAFLASQLRQKKFEFAELIAEMFERIVAGEKADIAVFVRRKASNPGSDTTEKRRVWQAVKVRLESGEEPVSAYEAVAREENAVHPRFRKTDGMPKPWTWHGIQQVFLDFDEKQKLIAAVYNKRLTVDYVKDVDVALTKEDVEEVAQLEKESARRLGKARNAIEARKERIQRKNPS